MEQKCEKMRKMAQHRPKTPPRAGGLFVFQSPRWPVWLPKLNIKVHYLRGSIQHAVGSRDPRALFTLRESRRGDHELCEHGSDRCETSAKRVSDDLQLLIF